MKTKMLGMLATILAVMAVVLAGCAGTGPVALTDNAKTAVSQAAAAQGTGNLEIRVTDAPAKEEITRIDVSVKSLEIKKVGSGDGQPDNITGEEGVAENETDTKDNSTWTVVPLEKDGDGSYPTFDLLTVKDNPETLSALTPAVGNYNVRLEVDSVMVTFGEGQHQKATVPSGKIKFSSPFEVTAEGITVLLLDFDASRSVNVAGNGKVMFKPVIKLSVSHENKGQVNNQVKNEGNTQTFNITTKNLPDGAAGEAYADTTLAANGGSGTLYTWEITGGALPEGLTLDGVTGEISGTPSVAGQYVITVKVTDGSTPAKTDTKEFTLKIKS
jgi:hypothetical protein